MQYLSAILALTTAVTALNIHFHTLIRNDYSGAATRCLNIIPTVSALFTLSFLSLTNLFRPRSMLRRRERHILSQLEAPPPRQSVFVDRGHRGSVRLSYTNDKKVTAPVEV